MIHRLQNIQRVFIKLKNRNIFLIYLKERDNTVTKQRIEIGLPEDKSNEWVRLCEWFDVNPSKPTELPHKSLS